MDFDEEARDRDEGDGGDSDFAGGFDDWRNEDADDAAAEAAGDAKGIEASPVDHLILLIDCRAGMNAAAAAVASAAAPASAPREPHLAAALRMALETQRLKIEQGDQARLAVLLLGTATPVAAAAAPPRLADASSSSSATPAGQRPRAEAAAKGLEVLLPLDAPSVEAIRILQRVADEAAIPGVFARLHGQAARLPVREALSKCMELFRDVAKSTDHRRIMFVTNDDDPGKDLLETARIKASDAEADNIETMVQPIQHPDRAPFDPAKFWNFIACLPRHCNFQRGVGVGLGAGAGAGAGASAGSEAGARVGAGADAGAGQGGARSWDDDDDYDDDLDGPGAPSSSASLSSSASPSSSLSTAAVSNVLPVSLDGTCDQLLRQTRRRLCKKRTYARLPLTLAPGVHIGVSLYNLIYPAKKPPSKTLLSETAQAVKTETRYVDAATGDLVSDQDMMHYHTVGGRRILFTPNEARELRAVAGKGRGIEIAGFQGREVLRLPDNLRPPFLVCPTERDIVGGSVAFRALWQRMLDRRLVAIALMTTRDGAAPRVVALLPEQERVDCDAAAAAAGGQVGQLAPPGLYAITLPFADDLRAVQAAKSAPAPVGDVNAASETAAREIVRRLAAAATPLPPLPPRETLGGSRGMAAAKRQPPQPGARPPFTSFDPASMPQNPSLHQFFAGLEALALTLRAAPQGDTLAAPSRAHEVAMGDAAAHFMEATGLSSMGSGSGSGRKRAVGAAKRSKEAAAAEGAEGGAEAEADGERARPKAAPRKRAKKEAEG